MKKIEYIKVKYTGPYPDMSILGIGKFFKDAEVSVIPENAVKLLRIKGFKKVGGFKDLSKSEAKK